MRPPDWGQPLSGARGLLAVVVDCVLLVQRGQRLGLLVGHVAGAALGACSWIMWWGQRLGPARGCLSCCDAHVCLWSSCRCVLFPESMCARKGALWWSCPSFVCPQQWCLASGGPRLLPSAPSVAIVQPLQALSVQLSPILPLDLTSDARASSMRPPRTPVDKRLRLGSAGWRSPLAVQVPLLCLLLTGSRALL